MHSQHTILKKERLADDIFRLKVSAALIASERKPGQFIILQLDDDYSERIPLTIADADLQEGSITLIFQRVGKTTRQLAEKREGDTIAHILGPLGQPTHIARFGAVVCIGGGIGAAPLYPIAQAMQAAGNKLIVILGARTKNLLILEKELASIAADLIICTDDGTSGQKALVTAPLLELCQKNPRPDLVVAIGPPIMMKFCAETTRPFAVPTVVSLNTIMVDGTGMCGGCRVSVDNTTKFVCVDGPEFDGHRVDFDNMIQRLKAYHPQEETARHQCKIGL
ncbi:MAG: sulfide/dihydroorotate dehydrogenase-like FAD/NAD-binding protein [Candidatus Omnitrophica bacterium]|nr:sulfide/dihydroorotate dehydrogenase-like FAD/NAD-binding protein [Candidatus Omnitrophota bacterium]